MNEQNSNKITEDALAASIGLVQNKVDVEEDEANEPELNNLDLVKDDLNTEANSKPKKAKNNNSQTFATSGTSRMIFVCGVLGVAVFGVLGFFGTALQLGNSEQPAPAPEVENVESEITLEEETVDSEATTRLFTYMQERELAEVNELTLETVEPEPQPEKIPPAPAATIARQPQPIPQPPRPVPQSFTPNTFPPAPPQIIEEKEDSFETLAALAKVGSYGNIPSAESNSVNSGFSSSMNNSTLSSSSAAIGKISPSIPPILQVNYSNTYEKTKGEREFVSLLRNPQPVTLSSSDSTPTIASNQNVRGKLDTPLYWLNTSQALPPQRLYISLSEPLLDKNNREIVPKEAKIIYQVSGIGQGGTVTGEAILLEINDKEYSLPKNAISVKGKSSGFLVAKFHNKKNTAANQDLVNAALGASKAITSLIERPSSSTTTFGQFGQTQDVQFENSDFATAIAAGATQEVLEKRAEDIRRSYEESPTLSYWKLKENTSLTIRIDRSFTFSQ